MKPSSQTPDAPTKAETSEDMLEVRMSYLVLFTAFYGFGTWHATWALAGNSQTTPVFEAKFGWTEDETITNNTLISSAGILGFFLGSLVGGHLLRIGRRKAAILA